MFTLTGKETASQPSSPVNKRVQLSTEAGAPQARVTCPRLLAWEGVMGHWVLAQPAPELAEPLHGTGGPAKPVLGLTLGCAQMPHRQPGCQQHSEASGSSQKEVPC